MTSRTTPVGILVLAIASLIAVGCTAQTSAVFEALLEPASAPASSSEAGTDADAAVDRSASATRWPHPEGYAMELPAGWSGLALERAQTGQLIDAIETTLPDLAGRITAVLVDSRSRVSAVAGDLAAGDDLKLLVVAVQPLEGRRPNAMKERVKEQIGDLPGFAGGTLVPHYERLPSAKGHRFDYGIEDPDLGQLRVRSYLFKFGTDAYLVNLIASEATADEAEAMFDNIAESLIFGV
jgi:hypothetical protein